MRKLLLLSISILFLSHVASAETEPVKKDSKGNIVYKTSCSSIEDMLESLNESLEKHSIEQVSLSSCQKSEIENHVVVQLGGSHSFCFPKQDSSWFRETRFDYPGVNFMTNKVEETNELTNILWDHGLKIRYDDRPRGTFSFYKAYITELAFPNCQ